MILTIQMPDDSLKHVLPPLDRLKVFEASARLLSFSQAARELCITKGAASYQIRMLEEELDTRLFKRSVRQVLLTDAGQLLFLTVQQVFAELGGGLTKLKRTEIVMCELVQPPMWQHAGCHLELLLLLNVFRKYRLFFIMQ